MQVTYFSTYLMYAAVNMVKDAITGRSKGFAFIQYTSQDDAMLALENMDQKVHILSFDYQH